MILAALRLPDPAVALLAFVFGAIVGSFLNVCIRRVPRRESLVFPGSRCASCGVAIRWFDNIPVLSWFLLRGRCRSCRAPFSIEYPLVEALSGGLLLALALTRGLSWRLAWDAVFVYAVLVLVFIDLHHKILPDRITLPGLALGLAGSPFFAEPGWRDAALGAALGALLPVLLYTLWLWLRGIEGLGLGDVKMLAMIGAFLGWQGVLFTLVLASLAGALVGLLLVLTGRRSFQAELPFGTFLGAAAITDALARQAVVGAYWRIVGWIAGGGTGLE